MLFFRKMTVYMWHVLRFDSCGGKTALTRNVNWTWRHKICTSRNWISAHWVIIFKVSQRQYAVLNLFFFTLRICHVHVKDSHEYVTFGMYVIFVRPVLKFKLVRILHKYLICRRCEEFVRILHTCDIFAPIWKSNESITRVKNLNLFVTTVKNSCEREG